MEQRLGFNEPPSARNKGARSSPSRQTLPPACDKPFEHAMRRVLGVTPCIPPFAFHIACRKLSARASTAVIPTSQTPRNSQENHSGQHFWPNLFLGRWLKVLAY